MNKLFIGVVFFYVIKHDISREVEVLILVL